MTIFKNNTEIILNEDVIRIDINEDDYIRINEYVRFFEPKLELGSLVLIDDKKEIYIENITNVINTSNAKIEFNDCLIDSMDELFELVKHSLGSGFSIDFNDVINDNDDEFTLNLFDSAEEINDSQKTQHIEEELEKDNTNLLIVIYTNNIDSILNFPLIYAKDSKQSNNWDNVQILFWNNAVSTIIQSFEIRQTLEDLKNSNVQVNYTSKNINNEDKTNLESQGISSILGEEILSLALKSNKWTVLTV